MAMPVEMSCASPGARVSGASRQARRSMPADPGVAWAGRGRSRPMRSSRMRSLMRFRSMASSVIAGPSITTARRARLHPRRGRRLSDRPGGRRHECFMITGNAAVMDTDTTVLAAPGPWVDEALTHYRHRRIEEALRCCDRALELDPAQATAIDLAGVIAFEARDLPRAVALFTAAVIASPGAAILRVHLGNAQLDN